MQWRYEPRTQEGRLPKHKWTKAEAGFEVEPDGKHTGMCPSEFSLELAAHLLNSGLTDSPPAWEKSYPRAIFNFHDGVVYKAQPRRVVPWLSV